MSMLLDQRSDGSVAFFIDGDLQFDSQDEHIYHECLALPALAIAESRTPGNITALIIGGGDGLTARELLKSQRVTHLDLVDYDSKVLQLATNEFAPFNQNSLADKRVSVHIEDARKFIKHAADSGTSYDVIVSDFTAAHDAEGAQLHTIEFYGSLRSILKDSGVLAVNTASPSGTPEAYWSIYNSILTSNLNPKPYRIFLPSFAAQGYPGAGATTAILTRCQSFARTISLPARNIGQTSNRHTRKWAKRYPGSLLVQPQNTFR
jgi:spermidine synthase